MKYRVDITENLGLTTIPFWVHVYIDQLCIGTRIAYSRKDCDKKADQIIDDYESGKKDHQKIEYEIER